MAALAAKPLEAAWHKGLQGVRVNLFLAALWRQNLWKPHSIRVSSFSVLAAVLAAELGTMLITNMGVAPFLRTA